MKRYLETLHTRPDHHKKRFALFVSFAVTMLIFSLWGLVNFGQGGLMSSSAAKIVVVDKEVSPLQSLTSSVSASLGEIFDSFGKLKSEVESVNLESDYTEMKNNVFEVYGQ